MPCAGVANTTKCRVLGGGPYGVSVSYGTSLDYSSWQSNAVLVIAHPKLSASPGRSPYFGTSDAGELLLRANSKVCPALSDDEEAYVEARTVEGGATLLQDEVIPLGPKLAIPISMAQMNPNGETWVEVTLRVRSKTTMEDTVVSTHRVRFTRVAQTKIGATSIDHNTRAILVDGEQFLPVSWTSTTMDSYGPDYMIGTLSVFLHFTYFTSSLLHFTSIYSI